MAIDVARHLGQCRRCDTTAQNLLALRDALAAESERAVSSLDLAGVWAAVDRNVERSAGQAAWRERAADRAASRRRVPRAVAWGTMAAVAAGAALYLRPAAEAPRATVAKATPPAVARTAARRLPNHVHIDRLAGKDIAVRREPKSGTTMIWVNHESGNP
jgi:hypothetical protein